MWKWWRSLQDRRNCPHQKPWPNGEAGQEVTSTIESRLIDLGRSKMWRCVQCQKLWFL